MNSRTRNLLIFILGLFVGLNWPKIKKYSEPYWQKIKKGTDTGWHKLSALFLGQKAKRKPEPEKSSLQEAIKVKPKESEKKIEEVKEEKKEELKKQLTIEKIMEVKEKAEEGKVKIKIKE